MNAFAATTGRAKAAAPASEGAVVPARHALLLAVCCTAQFMVILDVSIVNVALPTIRASLGFSATELQWIVNAYTIAFAGFLMLGGRAADLVGQRRTFVSGFLLFSFASLAGGLAQSRGMLIGARGLQGLGGAVMAPASLSIINSSFAPGPERHRAIGLWGAMNGAGGAAGVLFGGIITQYLGWRWILLINLPIGITAAMVARAAVPARRAATTQGSFDLPGALAITGGLLALVYGIVSAGSDGWGAPEALGPILLGLALLGAFVAIEARFAAAPLVPLRVFSNKLLRSANLIVLAFSAALFPMWYFLSLYLQLVLKLEPIGAGLAFLPMALTIMACATRAPRLVARFGAGPLLGLGLTLMALGLALLGRVVVNGGYISGLVLPGLLISVGLGLSIVPSTIAATAGVAPQEAGLASGLINTSRQMGGALGLAILTSLGAQYTAHLIEVDYRAPLLALDDGFRLAFLIAAAFAGIGAVAAFRLIPRVRPGGAGSAPAPAPASASAPTQAPASAPAAVRAPVAAPALAASTPSATVHPLPVPTAAPTAADATPHPSPSQTRAHSGTANRAPRCPRSPRGLRVSCRFRSPRALCLSRCLRCSHECPIAARLARGRLLPSCRRSVVVGVGWALYDSRRRRLKERSSAMRFGPFRGLAAPSACVCTFALLLSACGGSSASSPAAAVPSPLGVHASIAAASANPVTLSPLPGTADASPATQISFLGAPGTRVLSVAVSGSRSGSHAGRLQAYSTGDGESFLPTHPFIAGERVTVRASVQSGGGAPQAATTTFTIAHQAAVSESEFPDNPGDPHAVQHYLTQPTFTPSTLTVTTPAQPGAAPGDLFLAPYQGNGSPGPMIVNQQAQLVWFHPLPAHEVATNFQVQSYEGKPVLTWWQGRVLQVGFGQGEDVIYNTSYQPVATIHAGNGYHADLHEILITPQGTAWIDAFDPIHMNLASAHGSADGILTDSVVQEIDIKTGLVMWEWHAFGHIPLSDSFNPPQHSSYPWDYIHVNSIDPGSSGDVLISARNSWTLYDIDLHSGGFRWRLGGAHSNFHMGPGTHFYWQHDAEIQPGGLISVFDNGSDPPKEPQSRGLLLDPNLSTHTVTLVKAFTNPHEKLLAESQGNTLSLPGGDWLMGYGGLPNLTEYNSSGEVLLDATLGKGVQDFRTYLSPWSGQPTTPPALAVHAGSGGTLQVAASWNGATDVAAWRVLTGSSAGSLAPAVSAAASGFETVLQVSSAAYVSVQALSASGAVLGSSATVATVKG
jgi:EmrB/QacA subfamily drug resistance transporter